MQKRFASNGNTEFAGVDNARVDNLAPYCRDGICRSGQISTMWHHVAGMDNAKVDNAGVVKCLWKMCSRQVESHRLYVRSTHINSRDINSQYSQFWT